MRAILLFLLLVAIPATRAATYSVGGDGCTHTSIQAAVDAADANFGPDVVNVTRSAVYTSQSIVIDTDDSLTITGGLLGCGLPFYGDELVDIDGTGGSEASVFRIAGGPDSVVRLVQLRIRNGDPSLVDGLGGGIHYDGSGVLELVNVGVINSRAVKGGGIYANGDVETARLVLGPNVTISGNTARIDGGGVFINGMTLEMTQPDSIIAFNTAEGNGGTGYGGGLAVRSTGSRAALAIVSSSGVGSLGAIYGNEARRGGGVAVSGGDDASDSATLMLYSTDPSQPAAIRGNFASERGGAIYLWPNVNFDSEAYAYGELWAAELTGNAAPEGAAVSTDFSTVELRDPLGGTLLVNVERPPGAVACALDRPCSRISENITEDGLGVDQDGAVIHLGRASTLALGRGTWVEHNQAGRIVDGRPSGSSRYAVDISIDDAVLVDNSVSGELLRAEDDARLVIEDSTLANNAIGGTHVIAAERSLVTLRRSILWQPDRASLTASGGEPVIESVITNDPATLDGGPNAVFAPPRFIDPARGDYRLRAASQAIDFAPAIDGVDLDAYGRTRDVRLALVPRPAGTSRDIGAFERTALLPLVLNGDFDPDANLWFLPAGHSGNLQVGNAPGSAGGAAQVAGTSNAGRLLGYAQCIEIPGPGSYALNASARSEGDPALANDTALIWELRPNGGAGCIDGTITSSGIHALSSRATTDQWIRPAVPAYIDVPAAVWNVDTSLTIILAVYPNATNDGYNGLFDRVTLEPGAPAPRPDALFSNGFEAP